MAAKTDLPSLAKQVEDLDKSLKALDKEIGVVEDTLEKSFDKRLAIVVKQLGETDKDITETEKDLLARIKAQDERIKVLEATVKVLSTSLKKPPRDFLQNLQDAGMTDKKFVNDVAVKVAEAEMLKYNKEAVKQIDHQRLEVRLKVLEGLVKAALGR